VAQPEVSHHDVVIVGARCAGSASARLLAERGHDVVVLDRAEIQSDPLSTHGIARGGVVQLSRWGLLNDVLASGAPAIRAVTFGIGGQETTREVKDRAGVDLLVAPRRTVLDTILADAAIASGATVRTSTAVTDVIRDETGRVTGVRARRRDGRNLTLFGRHVVAADGLRSTLAPQLGATARQTFSADVSLYYTYVDQVAWRGFEFHVSPGAFAGVFPTHEGQACVWLSRPTGLLEGVRRAGAGRTEALVDAIAEVAPSLGGRIRSGRVTSGVRGIIAPPNYVRHAFGPGWALVGDAGYHRDPITGHGITDAFRDAELMAEALDVALRHPALEHEALRAYEQGRDDALAATFRLTRELARFPHPSRFVELQIELSEALDREARMLASRPAPVGQHAVPTA
jgi:flavin-dependent dehydrogenase